MNRLVFPTLGLTAGLLLSATLSQAEKPLSVIAFGSCLQEKRPQPIWESVLAAKPDLFVLLGDNIYGDTRDKLVQGVRDAKHAGFPAVGPLTPFLASKDGGIISEGHPQTPGKVYSPLCTPHIS